MKYINSLKYLLFIGFIAFIFSGCQDKNIQEYNKIAKEHQEKVQTAFLELNQTITYYNNKEYDKSIVSAKNCESAFTAVVNLSTQAKNIAQKFKNKQWLVDFKNYSIKSEEIRMNQCKLIGEVSQDTKDKNNEKAQKLIDEIGKLNDNYNKLQATLEDIKNQHPEAFQENK